jgi:glycosyltransferase involved in cell wall biosynthesis
MNHRPLKIVQTPVRYLPYIGGVEKYVFDLSNQLVKTNNEVTVICADEPKTTDDQKGVRVKRLPYIGKIANTNITPTLLFELLKTDFDVIHTHIPTPWSADMSMLASILKRKPLVVTYHNDLINDGPPKFLLAMYNKILLNLVLKRAAVIVITQKRYLETSHYLQKYKDKVEVVPNGFAMTDLRPASGMRDPNTVFFLSSLDKYHRYKGLDILIRAIAEIKNTNANITLLVGGAGELMDEYKALAIELGVESNVVFLGRIEEEAKNNYYRKASAFVLPSNSAEEGFGIVLLEAMANGAPVITTRYAGVMDDIQEYNAGYIVPENDPHALAGAITTLTNNPFLVEATGKNGHDLVLEKYAWSDVADKIYRIYSRIT